MSTNVKGKNDIHTVLIKLKPKDSQLLRVKQVRILTTQVRKQSIGDITCAKTLDAAPDISCSYHTVQKISYTKSGTMERSGGIRSVDDSQSFQNLSNWKKKFIYYADVTKPESFPFVILGNKVDISERQVSAEEAQAWCWDNSDHPYFETSAKDATNVTAAFEEAVRRVLATEYRSDHLIQTDTISLHRKPKPSSSCC
ncbi:hypothetical protein EI555_004852 [Monodon monoceros]|uniref:Uncharacterized protein n=1 Tax=Monodon monoceros TaxID=40151 RepID=A0A4U1F7A0_MONMO|nr:hypothetical protein EI555_004852 [Monodon monoceros]